MSEISTTSQHCTALFCREEGCCQILDGKKMTDLEIIPAVTLIDKLRDTGDW